MESPARSPCRRRQILVILGLESILPNSELEVLDSGKGGHSSRVRRHVPVHGAREAMKSIDLDDDGEINYAEFVKLLR